jgi:hypothetical protein
MNQVAMGQIDGRRRHRAGSRPGERGLSEADSATTIQNGSIREVAFGLPLVEARSGMETRAVIPGLHFLPNHIHLNGNLILDRNGQE